MVMHNTYFNPTPKEQKEIDQKITAMKREERERQELQELNDTLSDIAKELCEPTDGTKKSFSRQSSTNNSNSNTTLTQTETTPHTITGKLTAVRFFKTESGWLIGSIALLDVARTVNFTGNFTGDPMVGTILQLHGVYVIDGKYGKQFKSDCIAIDKGASSGGLINFISTCKELRGIGDVKARELVDTYGDNLADHCNPDGNLIYETATKHRVPVETLAKLFELLSGDQILLQAKTALAEAGLTQYQISRIINKYQYQSLNVIKNNPYILIEDLDGFGFQKADDIALKTGMKKNNECRIEAGILYAATQDVEAGNCWISLKDLIDAAYKVLNLDVENSKGLIKLHIERLAIDGKLIGVTADDGTSKISIPSVFKAEDSINNIIRQSSLSPNPYVKKLQNIDLPSELNDDQKDAVHLAFSRQFAVISGGAGTGKTYLIKTIIDTYKSVNKKTGDIVNPLFNILACAPTGKAARRIEESTGHPAQTVHRALGYDGYSWQYNSTNKLPYNVIIIDEFSMMDVFLTARLFEAIDWRSTAVVIVGDHQQLPPVGPGFPLRDFIFNDALQIPKKILTHCVRQAGILKQNSTAILNGNVLPTDRNTGELSWFVIDRFDPKNALSFYNFIGDMVNSQCEETFNLNPYKAFQILCPMKIGRYGVAAINALCQSLFQKKVYGVDVEFIAENWNADSKDKAKVKAAGKRKSKLKGNENALPTDGNDGDISNDDNNNAFPSVSSPAKFLTGDRVIQTKNDKKTGIMNGQIGYVVQSSRGFLFVEFDDCPNIQIKYSYADQANLQLAYALTIHKSQGSEFPVVLTIASKAHYIMLSRNLLYTAVTRARRASIIAGDKLGLMYSVEKIGDSQRRTWLDK